MGITGRPSRRHTEARKQLLVALLVVMAGVTCGTVSAAVQTGKDARQAVQRWLADTKQPLRTKLGKDIDGVDTYTEADETPLYHVVRLQPDGFVITSADDDIVPIVAFADDGVFGFSESNPLFALVTQDMRVRMSSVKKARNLLAAKRTATLKIEHRSKWRRLQDPATAGADSSTAQAPSHVLSDVRVKPLLETQWSQRIASEKPCYNYFTPQMQGGRVLFRTGDIDNYPCGCVATAVSQLLYHHRYPTQSPTQAQYPVSVHAGDEQSRRDFTITLLGGDLEGGPYQWDMMSTSATEEQRQAIGALCADAGAAVNTDYGPGGSGALPDSIVPALRRTFHYDNAVLGIMNEGELTLELESMINPNLDAGYPVLLCIYKQLGGGHAIVADGYGYNYSSAYYHLNLGWGGIDDAWYSLPDVKDYDFVGGCIYNAFPQEQGEIISGRVTNPNGDPVANVAVTLVDGVDRRSVTTNANGIYAFTGLTPNSVYRVFADQPDGAVAPEENTVMTGESVDLTPLCGNVWGVDFCARQTGSHQGGSPQSDPGLETFENGGLSSHLAWNTDWIVTDAAWTSAHHSVQSRKIGDNETTTLEITLNCQDGTVSFYYKVSSEEGYDTLAFYMDGEQHDSWSGEQDWAHTSYPIVAGQHTFTWTYAKDYMLCAGDDCAWLDDIRLPITRLENLLSPP